MVENKSEETEDKVNAYLWHRYLPPRRIPEWLWKGLEKPDGAEYTPEGAARQLDQLFDRLCGELAGPHLVPLSGGWDSRLILAALNERVGPSEIETVSFGCPGQLDYDIGGMVAKRLGIKHHALNLARVPLSWELLKESVKSSTWTMVPDGYFNILSREQAHETGAAAVWVGFLGDPLTGGHLSSVPPSAPQSEWQAVFARSQRRRGEDCFCEPNYCPHYPLIPENTGAPFQQTEWFDFGIRQKGCVAPIVLGDPEWSRWSAKQGYTSRGSSIIAPFCEPIWAHYWLNAPRKLHRGQMLYLEMAKRRYPYEFSLPSKYNFGVSVDRRFLYSVLKYSNKAIQRVQNRIPWLGIRALSQLNYIDYGEALRKKEDYKDTFRAAIDYLKTEQVTPWIDLEELWSSHMERKRECASALLTVLGLAVNIAVKAKWNEGAGLGNDA